MAIAKNANKSKSNTSSSSKEREVLGYWNPRGIITADAAVVKLNTQYGVSLYADDPVHAALFAAWEEKKDPSFMVRLIGTIAPAKKEEAEQISFSL